MLRNMVSVLLLAGATTLRAQLIPDLPTAITNNAVASGSIAGVWWAFSALGIDSTKRWSGITRRAFAWSDTGRTWRSLPDVPGAVGRIAATAQIARGRLFVIGGYTVDSSGTEHSLPNVDVYDPISGRWTAGASTPIAVDDAVSGVYRDSLIFVVSGWHETDNVRAVQVYDVVRDRWSEGTPVPGPGVFGHTGSLAENTLVYIDGAARQAVGAKYGLVPQVWLGAIDALNPTQILWSRGPAHPGPPLYRAAAAACGASVVIAGGTANPYNYNGTGYDGRPSSPRRDVLAFDTRARVWRVGTRSSVATMDHRGLVVLPWGGWILGGMRGGQRVSGSAVRLPTPSCLERLVAPARD